MMTHEQIAAMPDPFVLVDQITQRQWSDAVLYCCPVCPFQHYRQDEARKHVVGHIKHALILRDGPPAEVEADGPVLFGPNNKPISGGR